MDESRPVGDPESDDSTNPTDAAPSASDAEDLADESGTGSKSRLDVNQIMAQLQQALDQMSTAAGPTVREVGAKAAVLAAKAGEQAGPIAYKAADVTASVGKKVAAKGNAAAANLRGRSATGAADDMAGEAGASETVADDAAFGEVSDIGASDDGGASPFDISGESPQEHVSSSV